MFKNMNIMVAFLVVFLAISNPLKAQDPNNGKNQDIYNNNAPSGMKSQGDLKAIMQKMHTEMKQSKLSGDPEKDFAHLMVHHNDGAINLSEVEVQNGKNEELKRIAQKIIDDNRKDLVVLRRFSGDTEEAAARSNETSGTGMDRSGTSDTSKYGTGSSGTNRTGTSGTYGMGRSDTSSSTMGTDRTSTSGTYGSGTSGTMDTTGRIGTSGTMDTTGRIGTSGTNGTSGTSGNSGVMSGMDEMIDQMNKMETTGDIDKDYASMMIMHHEETIKMGENFISKNNEGDLTALAQKVIDNSRKEITELEKFSSR